MIERYIEILEQLRQQKIALKDFLYAEAIDKDELSYDLNAAKRYQLLKAMQYNRLETDEPILVELLKAEIERHQKEPFQGLEPALSLNAFLLSLYRKPAYTELFVAAKKANFDTYCGFDYQFLISAGIQETYAYIDEVKAPYAEDFYHYFGSIPEACSLSEEELQDWRNTVQAFYPDILELKDLSDEIELAIELDEKLILKEKINQWADSMSSWSETDLKRLSYYKRLIGDTKGELWSKEQLLSFKTTDWDTASALIDLSELYLKLNDYENTWSKLTQIEQHLKTIPDWISYGLGRSIIERYFELILAINNPDDDIVKEAYKWVSKQMAGMKNLYINLLEKAAKAADLMQDLRLSKKYYKMLESERKKLSSFK